MIIIPRVICIFSDVISYIWDQIQGLTHAKQVIHHWAPPSASSYEFYSFASHIYVYYRSLVSKMWPITKVGGTVSFKELLSSSRLSNTCVCNCLWYSFTILLKSTVSRMMLSTTFLIWIISVLFLSLFS